MPPLPQRYILLKRRLARFTRLLHGVEEGDVKAIHRTRVASRRLRELVPVLQIDRKVSSKLGHRLRKATRRLGSIRELNVLLLLLDEFDRSGDYPDDAVGLIREEIRREHSKLGDSAKSKKLAAELRRIARKIESVLADLKTDDGTEPKRAWRWALDARISRRAGALREAIAKAGALYLPERLHQVRIALKKLRYAIELWAEASGISRRTEISALKRSQDVLGRMHDLQVLLDRSRQAQASLNPPDVKDWRSFDTLNAMLEDMCRALHAKYVRQQASLAEICGRSESRLPVRRSARKAG